MSAFLGLKYREILETEIGRFIRNLPNDEAQRVFYMHDGAPAHNAQIIHEYLNHLFEDRYIANNGPFRWPARSPDLTPLDFFFWGAIKDKVFKTTPTTKEDCQRRVRAAVNSLTREQIRKSTSQEVTKRVLKCLEVQGGHFAPLL